MEEHRMKEKGIEVTELEGGLENWGRREELSGENNTAGAGKSQIWRGKTLMPPGEHTVSLYG